MRLVFIICLAHIISGCTSITNKDELSYARQTHLDFGILLGYHYCKWSKWPQNFTELKQNIDQDGLILHGGKPDWFSMQKQLIEFVKANNGVLLITRRSALARKFQSLHRKPRVCKNGVDRFDLDYTFDVVK